MKSIIEEAPSIAKAIENGWLKAGKPQEFSIKIFEEPVKNFFGMTKRSAKVGIFYADNQPKQEYTKQKFTPNPVFKTPGTSPQAPQPKRNDVILKPREDKFAEKITTRQSTEKLTSERATLIDQVIWTPEMIANVSSWLKQILEIMQSSAQFSIVPERFHLKVHFNQPFFDDKSREKQFFSGLSILIFQILKITYRRPLKGFKILFSAGNTEISAS